MPTTRQTVYENADINASRMTPAQIAAESAENVSTPVQDEQAGSSSASVHSFDSVGALDAFRSTSFTRTGPARSSTAVPERRSPLHVSSDDGKANSFKTPVGLGQFHGIPSNSAWLTRAEAILQMSGLWLAIVSPEQCTRSFIDSCFAALVLTLAGNATSLAFEFNATKDAQGLWNAMTHIVLPHQKSSLYIAKKKVMDIKLTTGNTAVNNLTSLHHRFDTAVQNVRAIDPTYFVEPQTEIQFLMENLDPELAASKALLFEIEDPREFRSKSIAHAHLLASDGNTKPSHAAFAGNGKFSKGKGNGKGKGPGKKSFHCGKCGRDSHKTEDHFATNPWCQKCSLSTHWYADCSTKKPSRPVAAAKQARRAMESRIDDAISARLDAHRPAQPHAAPPVPAAAAVPKPAAAPTALHAIATQVALLLGLTNATNAFATQPSFFPPATADIPTVSSVVPNPFDISIPSVSQSERTNMWPVSDSSNFVCYAGSSPTINSVTFMFDSGADNGVLPESVYNNPPANTTFFRWPKPNVVQSIIYGNNDTRQVLFSVGMTRRERTRDNTVRTTEYGPLLVFQGPGMCLTSVDSQCRNHGATATQNADGYSIYYPSDGKHVDFVKNGGTYILPPPQPLPPTSTKARFIGGSRRAAAATQTPVDSTYKRADFAAYYSMLCVCMAEGAATAADSELNYDPLVCHLEPADQVATRNVLRSARAVETIHAASAIKDCRPSKPYLRMEALCGYRSRWYIDAVARQCKIKLTAGDRKYSEQRNKGVGHRTALKKKAATPQSPTSMLAIDSLLGMPKSADGGFNHCTVIRNPGTNAIRVYPAHRNRSQDWIKAIRTCMVDSGLQTNSTILGPQFIQSDSDSIAKSAEFQDFLLSIGAKQRLSPPSNHGNNFHAEMGVRIIWEMALSILHSPAFVGLPIHRDRLWHEAIKHAAYIHFILPNRGNEGNISPFEAETGRKPDYLTMLPAVWGQPCSVTIDRKDRTGKLAPHSRVGFFIGIERKAPLGTVRVFMPDTGRVIVSDSVIFNHSMHGYKVEPANEDDTDLLLPPPTSTVTCRRPPQRLRFRSSYRRLCCFNGHSRRRHTRPLPFLRQQGLRRGRHSFRRGRH
jgi:hypothetical protein